MGIQNPKFYGIKRENRQNPSQIQEALLRPVISSYCGRFVFMGLNRNPHRRFINYSMEFQGGTSTNVTFNENMSQERIESEVVPLVEDITSDADVQKVTGTNEVIIKTRTLNVEERQAFEKVMQENFGVEEGKITAESISALSARR